MKKILFLSLILLGFSVTAFSQSSNVRVSGHVRSNGAYVQPHVRTAPNYTNRDNYSTKPNVNPYTGKVGTKQPDYKYYNPAPRRSKNSFGF
ncbi:MAG TPA: hypothetical protein PK239_02010 [Chitinophagales bacterium]|nr:hypothetical protein [Chitinophagales bacterium]HRK26042.1 hypothetical protein [Chitinophagales bacterium]